MNQEIIDFINQIDTAHYLTYLYMCIAIISLLALIYVVLCITFSLIVRKKRTRYLEKLTPEERKKCLEFKEIGIFTKVK